VIFIPPVHFSMVMVQRGTIIMFMPAEAAVGAPVIPAVAAIPMAGMPIPARSVSIAVIVACSFPDAPLVGGVRHHRPPVRRTF
jgi:hypothetical protein